jgi:hypothetical protein
MSPIGRDSLSHSQASSGMMTSPAEIPTIKTTVAKMQVTSVCKCNPYLVLVFTNWFVLPDANRSRASAAHLAAWIWRLIT